MNSSQTTVGSDDDAPPEDAPTVIAGMEPATDDPESVDRLHDVLSNRRRRQILRILDEHHHDTLELTELASIIAAWENDTHPDDVTYDDRKAVQVAIYQHHAPKMDDAGLLEYDKRAGELRLTTDVTPLLPRDDAATGGAPGAPAGGTVDATADRSDDEFLRWYALAIAGVVLAASAIEFTFPGLTGATLPIAIVLCAVFLLGAHDVFRTNR